MVNKIEKFINMDSVLKLKLVFLGVYISYNYKMFILFFSDLEIEEKIEKIDNYINNIGWSGFVFPLIITVLLLIIHSVLLALKSWIGLKVYKYLSKKKIRKL